MNSWLKVPIHGGRMVIDLSNWELYKSRPWHLSHTGYAVCRGGKPKRTVRFHRLVARTPEGLVTDHLNHDRLDNRSANLRVCTQKSNTHNSAPGRRGYCWDESKKKWMVRYRNTFYGRYETEQEAQRAAQLARSGVAYVTGRRKLRYLPVGVSRLRGSKRYTARAQINGVRYNLGTFDSPDEAEKAYKNIIKEKKQ